MLAWIATFEAMVSEATDACWRLLTRGDLPSVYLYFAPATATDWGTVFPVLQDNEPPHGSEPVFPPRLPLNVEWGQLHGLIWQACRRLPLLPHG